MIQGTTILVSLPSPSQRNVPLPAADNARAQKYNACFRKDACMGGFYLPMQACVLSFRNRRFLSPPSYSLPICRFPCLFYPSRIPFPVIQSLVDPTYAAGSFRVQRYGGRTLFKYRCRYLKRNLTTAFRNRRLRHFIKFHSRFLARCSCMPRLERT